MKTRKKISYILTAVVAVIAIVWIYGRVHRGLGKLYTDNAEVCRRIVPVNSRVQGYIKEIRFDEFSPVAQGDTLVIIDDTDLKLGVARAMADYQRALAAGRVTRSSVDVAAARATAGDASVDEARVMMENAATDLERYKSLLERGAVTQREYDAVNTEYQARVARYRMLQGQSRASSTAVGETSLRRSQDSASVALAEALLETARQNLSYSVITAPCDGYTSRKDIQSGQLVQPGQTLLDIVDTTETWVTANFKETQVADIRPGDEVNIMVDAIPDVVFKGRVQSLSSATGAALSMIPQDNSAGNFVKVRRRIPVKIVFTSDNAPSDMARLAAGMNVECEIVK